MINEVESIELPKYQCHKVVHALKIKSLTHDNGSNAAAIITPEDEGYLPISVDAEYVKKHDPQPGGYYVVYEGGYVSWSPAEAFEAGYTRIN